MTDPVFLVPSVKPIDLGAAYYKSFTVCAAPSVTSESEIVNSLRSQYRAFTEEGWTKARVERLNACSSGGVHWRVTRA